MSNFTKIGDQRYFTRNISFFISFVVIDLCIYKLGTLHIQNMVKLYMIDLHGNILKYKSWISKILATYDSSRSYGGV